MYNMLNTLSEKEFMKVNELVSQIKLLTAILERSLSYILDNRMDVSALEGSVSNVRSIMKKIEELQSVLIND